MRMRLMVAGVVFVTATSAVEAQCAPGTTQDACRKATDLLFFMTPQLSTALVGGNPTLGQGGALGGFGHFSIDIRGGATNGSLPKLDNVGLSTTGQRASTFTSKDQMVPAASLDAGVGLWRGVSLGVTHVGGLDAIVTATYLPNNSSSSSNEVNYKVNGSNWQIGYGARVGLLEEGVAWPGVSFVYAQRDLPSISVSGNIAASGTNPGGTIALNNFDVKTKAWRLTAAKNLLILGLSAGYGQDKYDATSSITATVNAPAPIGTQSGTASAPLSMTRSNVFVGVALNVFLFKIEGEYGQVSGGSVPSMLNSFGSGDANALANKSRSYFTLGLRFGR